MIIKWSTILNLALACVAARQPAGVVRGVVLDQRGAVIVGADLTITMETGGGNSTQSDREGSYVFRELAPGRYTLQANAKGFATYEKTGIELRRGQTIVIDIKLNATIEEQKVTVPERDPLSAEPDNNVGAIVLRGRDLDILPNDPNDLEQVLRALAGPGAGPDGAQFFVDGFSGGRLPNKATIREIRINQNPFSAENDRLGFGSVLIITRPGTDKLHGFGVYDFSDESLNSRNPFALNRAPYQKRYFFGGIGGPLVEKRATIQISGGRQDLDDNAVINATVLNSQFQVAPFSRAVIKPQRNFGLNARVDVQVNAKHTLNTQYDYNRTTLGNVGVGEFSLLGRAYSTMNSNQNVRIAENAILSSRAVNETRFQFNRARRKQEDENPSPSVNVLEAFSGGGAQVGMALNSEDRWELINTTTLSLGRHTMKFGGRLRVVGLNDVSPANFGGTFTFGGGLAPVLDAAFQPVLGSDGSPLVETITSLERYRRTLALQQLGRTPSQIRALGGGATQFSIAGGDPEAKLTQIDFGGFIHNDWRIRPNFTLGVGLRVETQNNIDGRANLAPRIAFAWAPRGGAGGRPPRTVVRGGFGLFYNRFAESLSLQARRFNGTNQQQYIVEDSSILDRFPIPPAAAELGVFAVPQTIRRIAPDLQAPYSAQTAVSLERQLPRNLTVSISFISTRMLHVLRTRNLNAPPPGTMIRPLGDAGNIFAYESSGIFKQRQLIVMMNHRFTSDLRFFIAYYLNQAGSDTDGPATFPANGYDLRSEYGRSLLDVRHNLHWGASFNAPWGLAIQPLILFRSGAPFNITTGRDANGDALFTDRPAFAINPEKPGLVKTAYGLLDPNPTGDVRLIPRNFGDGPGFVSVNLRLSKRIGFGASPSPPAGQGNRGSSKERPYNFTFSVTAQNLLNHTNPGAPIGNLSSPLFGLSNAPAAPGYGFGSSPPASSNRRIELSLAFNF